MVSCLRFNSDYKIQQSAITYLLLPISKVAGNFFIPFNQSYIITFIIVLFCHCWCTMRVGSLRVDNKSFFLLSN